MLVHPPPTRLSHPHTTPCSRRYHPTPLSAGKLWVAQWGGSRVVRYDPATGAVLAIIKLPTAHISSVAFGGPTLSDIYITTAKEFMTPADLVAQPHAGDIFMVKGSPFRGLPAQPYRG